MNKKIEKVVGANYKVGYVDSNGNQITPFKYLDHEFERGSDFTDLLTPVAIELDKSDYYKKKYGLINMNGEEVVPLIYDEMLTFSEGMIAVRQDIGEGDGRKQYWGFMNNSGKLAIPFIYHTVKSFKDGLALVQKSTGEYGYIDKSGELVIPLIYYYAESFVEGLAIVGVREGRYGCNYGYINTHGKIVIPLIYDRAFPFKDGLASVSKGENSFLINKKGVQQTPEIYCDLIKPCRNGLRILERGGVRMEDYDRDIDYYGLMSSNGKVIVEAYCKLIHIWNNNPEFSIVEFRKSYYGENVGIDGWYLIDKTGNMLTHKSYDKIYQFVEDIAICQRFVLDDNGDIENLLYGGINNKGVEIIECKYEKVSVFRDGVAALKLNGKWGLTSKNDFLTQFEFDDICLNSEKGDASYITSLDTSLAPIENIPKDLAFIRNNVGIVVKDKMYGLIDRQGNQIAPCVYDKILPSSNNEVMIYKDGWRSGFINNRGVKIIPAMYENTLGFSEGLAACQFNGEWGFINKSNQVVIPFKFSEVGSFSYGLARVRKNNLWGYIDEFGKIVVRTKFMYVEDFFKDAQENIYALVEKWDGKSRFNDRYIINTRGKIVHEL